MRFLIASLKLGTTVLFILIWLFPKLSMAAAYIQGPNGNSAEIARVFHQANESSPNAEKKIGQRIYEIASTLAEWMFGDEAKGQNLDRKNTSPSSDHLAGLRGVETFIPLNYSESTFSSEGSSQ